MHIFVHDYAGHPFQVELSRSLARRGHKVSHVYFAGDLGPKGDLSPRQDDHERLSFISVSTKGRYDKKSFVGRRFKDIEYGRAVGRLIEKHRPDLVLSGNTPTEAQVAIQRSARNAEAAFIHWVQDFYSIAASRILAKRLGPIGALIGRYYRHLERRQFQRADAIVLITDDFADTARPWSGDPRKIFTIENWGAINEIAQRPKENDWAAANGLKDSFVFLYSGTLALKHDPELILLLARHWNDDPSVRIVIVGHGVGVDHIRSAVSLERLTNLIVFPLQPFSELSNVLGSADVLMAVIEPEAGVFSVPSKVQSYLCAARPILLAAPPQNLASKVLMREQAGLVVDPEKPEAFLAAADTLHANPGLRFQLASNGLSYAQKNYDIERVTDRFLEVFQYAGDARTAPRAKSGRKQLATTNE